SRQLCERIAGRSVERPRGGHRRYVRALRLEVQLIKLVAALVGEGHCAGLEDLRRHQLDASADLALQLAEDGERLFRSVCDEVRILEWILAGASLDRLKRADGSDFLEDRRNELLVGVLRGLVQSPACGQVLNHDRDVLVLANRSEERRVGKACRVRWWQDDYRKTVAKC